MFRRFWQRDREPAPTSYGPVVIYHHISKTGGTSLRQVVQANYKGKALQEWYGPNRGSVAWYEEHYHALSPRRKAAIQCIASHSAHYLIPVIDRPFRVFTLVREPVDRVISLYYFTKILARSGKGKGAEIGRALEELGWELTDIYQHLGNQTTITPEQHRLFAPFFNGQARAILGPHMDTASMPFVQGLPDILTPFQDKLQVVLDAHYELGVTEDYDRSVRYFAQVFGWRRVFFRKKNPTRNRPRLDELPAALIAVIRSFNALDVWLHEYAQRYLASKIVESPDEP